MWRHATTRVLSCHKIRNGPPPDTLGGAALAFPPATEQNPLLRACDRNLPTPGVSQSPFGKFTEIRIGHDASQQTVPLDKGHPFEMLTPGHAAGAQGSGTGLHLSSRSISPTSRSRSSGL